MKNNLIIVIVLVLVIGAIGGFFAGMQYQKTQRGTFTRGQFMMNGNFQRQGVQGGNFQGTRPIFGDIQSVDDTGITVKLSDGSTKIIIVSGSTLINKADKGTKSDLKVGDKVAAFGSANSDGSITAQSIQLNPTIRMGGTPK